MSPIVEAQDGEVESEGLAQSTPNLVISNADEAASDAACIGDDDTQEADQEWEGKHLLGNSNGEKGQATDDMHTGVNQKISWKEILSELKLQALMAGPLAGNMLCLSIMNMITLSFAGKFGTQELAAAALATSVTFMFGRLPMVGMSCALDTLASQAFGAGQKEILAIVFQRTCAFLFTHACGLSVIIFVAPTILEKAHHDAQLISLIASYSRALLPSIFLDAINRPMNRVLVAQRITQPQAWIQAIVTVLHLGTNYILITVFKGPFVLTAWCYTLSALYTLIISTLYFVVSKKGYCAWGSGLTLQAFQGWKEYAKLAYPAGFMQCAESWCWGSMNLLAVLMPNPETSVASLSIAFSLFTSMYFVYLSQALACSTRVGNLIGGGKPREARIAVSAAQVGIPFTWAFSAFLFSEPHIRSWLIWIYTDGTDKELVRHIGRMLWLMILLNFVDGIQTVTAGVIQGLGRQMLGLKFNIVAFYLIAIPTACLFGFALHLDVEGLYVGLIFGATTQCIFFISFTRKVNWMQEADDANSRVQSIEQNKEQKETADQNIEIV